MALLTSVSNVAARAKSSSLSNCGVGSVGVERLGVFDGRRERRWLPKEERWFEWSVKREGLPPVPVPVPVELLRDDRECACASEYAMFCVFFVVACSMLLVVLR